MKTEKEAEALKLEKETTEQKRLEEKLKHFNIVLRAIRNVNQLIVKERNLDRLLQGACDNLIYTRGYHTAWIALIDESHKIVKAVEAGFGKKFFPMVEKLLQGEFPHCIQKAFLQPNVVTTENMVSACPDCPLAVNSSGRGSMTAQLEYSGKLFGFLTVSTPYQYIQDEEEHSLFDEVAGDIAYALHNFEVEEEERRLKVQILQAQKMEAMGRLAGGVAHDFNNWLTVIQGASELMMMEIDETNHFYRNLKQIQQATGQAAALTHQLLCFGRRQPMERKSIDLSTTVNDLLKMLHRLIGEDIVINTHLASDLWTVVADPGNVQQVMMNLAVNARDAMSGGGRITIKTENVHIDDTYCKVYNYSRPGKFVCLSVTDTGIGMEKGTVNKIFESFFTTKEPGKGTGLGLSIVYGIVKQHEGWINVHSEPGIGTTFRIYLPAHPKKTDYKTEDTFSLENFVGRGERILVVEDEKQVREVVADLLNANGYIVFEVPNVKEALGIFEKEKGDFDLVFTDVILPDKTGLQLIEQLLSLKSELRVVVGSGYMDDKSQWPIIEKKGYPYLNKPYTLANLLQTIRKALEPN